MNKTTKHIIFTIICLFVVTQISAQIQDQRLQNIEHQLQILGATNNGFTESVKSDINVSSISLTNFLLAISEAHKININVSPQLNQTKITNTFNDVAVIDVLLFLCKEHNLTIDFTGTILSIKPYIIPLDQQIKEVPVTYNPNINTISIDAKGDKLYQVFKTIMDKSGKNLLFTNDLQNTPITAYMQNVPFDAAIDNLALANNLFVEHTKDNFYVFEANILPAKNDSQQQSAPPIRRRKSNFFFEIIDPEKTQLKIDAQNTPIGHIIQDIGTALDIDIFTATPLDNAGTVSITTKSITFDELLDKIFEKQQGHTRSPKKQNGNNQQTSNRSQVTKPPTTVFSYKKENGMYFFGTEEQLSIRSVEIITLQYRSVESLSEPMTNEDSNSPSSRVIDNLNSVNENYGNSIPSQQNTGYNSNRQIKNNSGNQSNRKTLLELLPEEITEGLDIKTDFELNSFYVTGTSAHIRRFKSFIQNIDKPVPVILVDVMIIEINNNSITDTGIGWGIGDNPVETKGALFPETDLTLGSKTVNKILGNFNGFGGFNLGKVGVNFFATIKFMESNGDLKIISTPKLATLNSHRATFSNGQTSYYAVTQRNIYGTNNPQTSEITNYLPIDAKLGLNIRPSVTGDGHVILDINVIQSSFGARIDKDAPPDITSRNFSSIIRMEDQDWAILGGIEEQMNSNSGSGVPFLSRVPVIKYLFSKRNRQAKKAKLTVLIKPTIIY